MLTKISNLCSGEKTSIHWFKGYLVIVSREPKVSSNDPIQQGAARPPMHDEGTGTLLTIYDLKVRLLALIMSLLFESLSLSL